MSFCYLIIARPHTEETRQPVDYEILVKEIFLEALTPDCMLQFVVLFGFANGNIALIKKQIYCSIREPELLNHRTKYLCRKVDSSLSSADRQVKAL